MMATRLTDTELAARTRAANQRRAARQLERRRAAGLVQLNVWIDANTKARIEAARLGAALNETAERLLLAGLHATTTPASNDNQPVYTVGCDKAELMNEVAALLNEGLSGADIARQLNASGQRTANGAAFTGQNILRDYRAWSKKRDTE